MADIAIAPLRVAAADLALPTGPVLFDGLRLSLRPAGSRYSLRAREADVLAGVLGRALPQKIGDSLYGLARLGPDEWYASLPAGEILPTGAGLPVSVVDVSSRAVGILVEGQRAQEVVSCGCPLDLARVGVGQVRRTLFETVEVLMWRESETRIRLDVWRSFAPWLFNALVACAE